MKSTMRVLLISYDNDDHIGHLPLGLGYLASAVGDIANVDIYPQDIYHWPDELLTDVVGKYDVVGVGMCAGAYPYQKLLSISRAINASPDRKRFRYVLGGYMVSADPEYFLDKTGADGVVVGEGEISFRRWLTEGGRVVKGVLSDVDSIAWPDYSLFDMAHYSKLRKPGAVNSDRMVPMMSGRGCPFHCNFCWRMDDGFRPRSAGGIVEEIEYLKTMGINYIFFADDLLMSSESRALEICDALEPLKVKWCCSGRLNYASVEVLERMKATGCVFINYGIESLDAVALKMMHKALSPDKIVWGVENTLKVGIAPGLNVLWGNIGETVESLQKGVEFLLKYDSGAQLRTIKPVTPYPNCELYKIAVDSGKLGGTADFYENVHINPDKMCVNFTDIPDEEFHNALFNANVTLLKNYYQNQNDDTVRAMQKLYFENAPFRGFRRY